MDRQQYLEINKRLWNERTTIHFNSAFYDVESFIQGKSSLNEIESGLIGDVNGKSLLHLQCHFGMDTFSFARLGAEVTGIDFSDAAITTADELKKKLNLPATFICCDLYDALEHLDKQFDIVFTSYGTIGWLPDLDKWAHVVASSLKPGGTFLIVEFHPVVWMFDNEIKQIQYSYFNKEVIEEIEEGTYADKGSSLANKTSVSWNHSLDEVITALIDAGLTIEIFREYDYSPYNIFTGSVEREPSKFHIAGLEGKLPLVYAIRAKKTP